MIGALRVLMQGALVCTSVIPFLVVLPGLVDAHEARTEPQRRPTPALRVDGAWYARDAARIPNDRPSTNPVRRP